MDLLLLGTAIALAWCVLGGLVWWSTRSLLGPRESDELIRDIEAFLTERRHHVR